MADASGTEPTPTQELRLEPVQFIARTDAVLRLGSLMLGAGGSSARVSDSMRRAADALGIERLQARVGMKDIVLTASRGQLFRTRVAEIRSPAVDADRLTALKRLTTELRPGLTPAMLQRELDDIERIQSGIVSVAQEGHDVSTLPIGARETHATERARSHRPGSRGPVRFMTLGLRMP